MSGSPPWSTATLEVPLAWGELAPRSERRRRSAEEAGGVVESAGGVASSGAAGGVADAGGEMVTLDGGKTTPLWPTVYWCLRCGDLPAAVRVMRRAAAPDSAAKMEQMEIGAPAAMAPITGTSTVELISSSAYWRTFEDVLSDGALETPGP